MSWLESLHPKKAVDEIADMLRAVARIVATKVVKQSVDNKVDNMFTDAKKFANKIIPGHPFKWSGQRGQSSLSEAFYRFTLISNP